jgi:hypothetical protein
MWKAAVVLVLAAVMVFGVFLIWGTPSFNREGPRPAAPPPTMQFAEAVVPVPQFQPPTETTDVEESPGPIVERGDFTVAGPYTHQNLAVFLIRGAERLTGKEFLTLEEALQAGQAVIHETRSDNLAIENRSATQELFLQAGDVFKGGTPD